jgi:hypothetical protein
MSLTATAAAYATPSPFARWARNVAVFGLQLILVGMVLHRIGLLATPVTLNIFVAAFAGAALAVLLALLSFIAIWREGRTGAWRAGSGLLLGLAILAWPAVLVPLYRKLPEIHDISTDTSQPPSFAALAAGRPAGANSPAWAGAAHAGIQLASYPDIRPVIVPRPINETWEVMGETVRRLRWKVAVESPPRGRGQPGIIEATDRTLILGFYDDIVIRMDGSPRETRIDVRSASRFGLHDFGRNASRIRSLLKEFQTRLDATVTGSDRPRRRRPGPEAAVPKRGKGDPALAKAQKQQQGRALKGSQREPLQKVKQPSRAADQARGRRPPQ